MKAISEKLVDQTWKEVASLDGEEANREMMKTCETQPDLVAYVTTMTENRSRDAQETAIYIFFVIHRIFDKAAGRKLKKIRAKDVEKFHENNFQLMERLESAHNKFLERAARVQLAGQPQVMKYLVEALMEPGTDEDPVQLSDEDQGLLYIILKTVVDLLDEKA